MPNNLLVMHGGGPTAVINSSLYGVIAEAKKHPEIGKIYAANGGTGGLLQKKLIDLGALPQEKIELLLQSPASAIGTSRDHMEPEDYAAMLPIFNEFGIKYVLMNGGNGTMDACGHVFEVCEGTDIKVIGIPKTMDNDIAITDHAPGYGSAARYVAASTAELVADVKSMPIHVVVLECSGRNAGWVTAASALAADCGVGAPDLIYLPERDFDEEQFLADVKKLIDEKGFGVVAVSEGLHGKNNEPLVPPIFKVGRATYFGDIGAHLANLIIQKLGYKARSEKPGLLGRASIAWQSSTDRDEARLAGEKAVQAALAGESGKMVGFERVSTEPYSVKPILIDTKLVMLNEKQMPSSFINEAGNGVTKEFCDWCRPLLGGALPQIVSFK